jgi:putative spermidine/putrescine transport system substrate-binding protein
MSALAPEASATLSNTAEAPNNANTLTVFSQGDVNVQSEWTKVLVPGFERAFPGDKIKLVYTTLGSENTSVYDEIAAAAKAGKNTSFDIVDGGVAAEGATAHLLVSVNKSELPLISHVNADAFKPVNDEAVPLRGSQVLLAYNSKAVPHPPKTLKALIAWVKAHSGEFTYCNPSDGGSGAGFVQDVVSSYLSPATNLKMSLGYDPKAEAGWSKGFAVLKSIGADVFQQQYPNSNTGVLTLLASGTIDLGTVWSDEGTAAIKDGQLPKSIKLTGITPPMDGGPDYLGVPKNIPSTEKALAFKFINWALGAQPQAAIVKVMDGTPGVKFQYLPASLRKQFAGYGSAALPYSAKTGSDLDSQWTSKVA